MAAIITDQMRKQNAANLIADIQAGTSSSPATCHYIGIGKSDPWENRTINGVSEAETSGLFEPPTPINSISEREDVKNNLIALSQIDPSTTGAIRLIPKVEWKTGRRYKVYDPYDPSCFNASNNFLPCYALYEGVVYVCLGNNNGGFTSTTITNANKGVTAPSVPFHIGQHTGGDQYIWCAVYKVDTSTNNKYSNAAGFLKIPDSTNAAPTGTTPLTNLKSTSGGLLYGFKILDGGSGFAIGDTAKLVGYHVDGDEFTSEKEITLTISSTGVITGIPWSYANAIASPLGTGDDGVKEASLEFTTSAGTGAKILPLIAPAAGFGADPLVDLPSYYVGVNSEFTGNMNNDAQTIIDYRQISIVKFPTQNSNDVATDESLDALQFINVSNLNDANAVGLKSVNLDGVYVEQTLSTGENPKAWVDLLDSNKVYFHQNTSTIINKKPLQNSSSSGTNPENGGTLTFKSKDNPSSSLFTIAAGTYSTVDDSPEYVHDSGEILFVDNKKPIARANAQNEQIRLIIQF
jgi:hypothetical protein